MPRAQINKKNILLIGAVLTVAGISGWITQQSSMTPESAPSADTPALTKSEQVDQHFKIGVHLMENKAYELAAGEWEKLLQLNSQIPEAHVNYGFTLIELKKYQQAFDHFIRATELNPYQANAYYGLGICYDNLGDTEMALGSMRSYIHLTQEGDPYVRKARSAIWEWESPLDDEFLEKRQGNLPPPINPQ